VKLLEIKLFSADGKVVHSEEIKAPGGKVTKTISLSGMAAGVYFLRIENNEYSSTVKVVVE
jgi:hypothetical protein